MSKIRLFVCSWHRKSCSCAERFSVPTGAQEVYKNPPQRSAPVFKQMARLNKQHDKLVELLSDVKLTNYKDKTAQVVAFLEKYTLFRRAGDVQQLLLRLIQAELEDGDAGQAQKLADVTQEFVRLLAMHPYTGHAAQLMTALHRQDTHASVEQIRAMFDALQTPWRPGEGLLYAHSGMKKGGHTDMLAGIVREMRESAEYAFLQENAEFRALLAAYTPDGCLRD